MWLCVPLDSEQRGWLVLPRSSCFCTDLYRNRINSFYLKWGSDFGDFEGNSILKYNAVWSDRSLPLSSSGPEVSQSKQILKGSRPMVCSPLLWTPAFHYVVALAFRMMGAVNPQVHAPLPTQSFDSPSHTRTNKKAWPHHINFHTLPPSMCVLCQYREV
jgi:hypothetical protein